PSVTSRSRMRFKAFNGSSRCSSVCQRVTASNESRSTGISSNVPWYSVACGSLRCATVNAASLTSHPKHCHPSAGFKCTGSRPQVHPSTVSDSLDFCLDDLWGVKESRQRKWLYYMLFPLTAASYALGNWGCIELAAVKGKAGGLR